MLSALIQLPLPQPTPHATRANVPLACACLGAHAASSGFETRLAPASVQEDGGDALILDWLHKISPEVLGFTTYLWNVERTLRIAAAWKAGHPGSTVVLGGPEMSAADAGKADVVVLGEGEAAWTRILAMKAAGGAIPACVGPSPPQDPSVLPDPYLSGMLRPARGGSVFLETVRGCTRRCDYCYYSKASRGLRSFPRERIGRVVALAREHGAGDLYVMDPCFNAAPDYLEKLAILAQANTSRIPLHTEIELESVTPEAADLYARAGFVSVEAGLQSTNPAALRAVHRGFAREPFLRGARLLGERGIRVRTGVILGLPRDTPEGFHRTIRFVLDAGLGPGVEVYPLSVLPGTGLRERAAALGIRHMSEPPYWVLR